jgi:hypothetical protein
MRLPVALNGFALWLTLMIDLTIVNYGYPIAQLLALMATSFPQSTLERRNERRTPLYLEKSLVRGQRRCHCRDGPALIDHRFRTSALRYDEFAVRERLGRHLQRSGRSSRDRDLRGGKTGLRNVERSHQLADVRPSRRAVHRQGRDTCDACAICHASNRQGQVDTPNLEGQPAAPSTSNCEISRWQQGPTP